MFSGVHGETFNCPAEINEVKNGLIVRRLELNTEDGGEGEFVGGRGIVTEYEIRGEEGFATLAFTRSKFPPWAVEGGLPGSPNYCEITKAETGVSERHSTLFGAQTAPGDVIRIVTGNGGGSGDPKDRAREDVMADIRDGLLTEKRATEVYGV